MSSSLLSLYVPSFLPFGTSFGTKKAEGAAAADVAAATAATGVCTATVNAPPGNPETVGLKILSQPQLANHTLLSFENLKKVRENKKLS